MAREQVLYIEGIRFSVEMVDLAHSRLKSTLPGLSRKDGSSGEGVLAMLDAWSMTDSFHRLRGLISRMPGLTKKKQSPWIRGFFEATKNVAVLRNTIQHLDSEIPKSTGDQDWAVLGSLHWGVVDEKESTVISSTFMPGVPMGSRPVINPAGRDAWHSPVDAITLERSGVAVCLSDATRKLEAWVRVLEQRLEEAYAVQFPNMVHPGSDLTINVEFTVDPSIIRNEPRQEREEREGQSP